MSSELINAAIEIGTYAFACGSGVVIGGSPRLFKWTKKLLGKQTNERNSTKRIKWAWLSQYKAFCCPMCDSIAEANQPPFCECDGTPHFHFECPSCKFKAIMDPANKE